MSGLTAIEGGMFAAFALCAVSAIYGLICTFHGESRGAWRVLGLVLLYLTYRWGVAVATLWDVRSALTLAGWR